MKHSILTIAAILAFSLTVACKKEKKEEKKTNTELLTQSPWKVQKSKDIGRLDGQVIYDETDTDYNVTVTFTANGKVTMVDHEEGFTDTSSWVFKNNESILEFGDGEFNIQTLSETELVIYYEETYEEPGQGTYEFTSTIFMTH
ncbi:MAG: hypothetical protein ACPF9D_04445 [Owenweeksia sp.]